MKKLVLKKNVSRMNREFNIELMVSEFEKAGIRIECFRMNDFIMYIPKVIFKDEYLNWMTVNHNPGGMNKGITEIEVALKYERSGHYYREKFRFKYEREYYSVDGKRLWYYADDYQKMLNVLVKLKEDTEKDHYARLAREALVIDQTKE
jgi:hypothetical protein